MHRRMWVKQDLVFQNNVSFVYSEGRWWGWSGKGIYSLKIGKEENIVVSQGEKNTRGGLNCVYFFFVFSY